MSTQQDSTFEEDIKQILTEVPIQIRKLFTDGKVETIAKNLIEKNQLRVEQGAIVEREMIMLLLGIKDPEEITRSFIEEAKIDQKTIISIFQDINAQIFVPLQKSEMKAERWSEEKQATIKPIQANPKLSTESKPVFSQVSDWIKKVPEQSSGEVKHFNLENKIPPPPPRTTPQSAKPIAGEKLLEDHEEPHIDIKPQQNLPGSVPNVTVPNVVQKQESKAPPAPTEPKPPIKSYSVDPYREPIE